MKNRISVVFVTFITFLWLSGASASVVGVDWLTASGSNATGDLAGIGVTMTNLSGASINTFDMSGSNYSAAPLGTNQERLDYGHDNTWTATFDSAVTDLLLYAVYWRGPSAPPDPANFSYEFDHAFTIESGFSGGSGSGSNTLTLTSSSYQFGILRFSGSLNSLSQISTTATNGNQQAMTFGTQVPVPAPAGLLILAIGLLLMRGKPRKA